VFRRLILAHLTVLLLAVTVFGVLAARSTRVRVLDEIEKRLESKTEFLRSLILSGLSPAELQAALQDLGRRVEGRLTVIGPDGKVLADSHADPSGMDNHNERPEVRVARSAGRDWRVHYSETLRCEMMYYALHLGEGKEAGVVLRCALPLTKVNAELAGLYRGIVLVFVIVALGGAAVSWLLARWITRPLREIQAVTRSIAEGDFSRKAPLGRGDEVSGVAAALNRMSDELSARLEKLEDERSKLEAVFSGMREGVVAVSREGEILHLNRAAGELLGLAPGVSGLKVAEAIRFPEVSEGLRRVLGGEASSRSVVETGALTLLVEALPVGGGRGAVLVARDVTEQRKYDELRKEFVANVSHELRTPLSVIRGYVETLGEGALGDPERAPGFLETIEKNVLRLGRLVDDLLELSRMESGGPILKPRPVEARALLEKVLEDFRPLAERKRQRLSMVTDPGLGPFQADPDFLERAVRNLVDNAVKYVPEGGSITLWAGTERDLVVFKVRDDGPGIPKADLPRLFERFYRVDKSRSRELGGTGLGLAIVKHIAQLHGGEAAVESEPGSGSVFSFRLPRR
jgi:two-component system phosphate regulon sensor histidine kinase PhoR